MPTFTLRIEQFDAETGLKFNHYETTEHGWKSKEDFLSHIKRTKTDKTRHELIENGYIEHHRGAEVKQITTAV